ncbi:hypothetical protein DPEC_G00104030 [Dallia pectoralis]|uniref:Uncharacterized protein n=1 Tax=Dallia pectoralis TaxID=75939 RepID=A0ACC2GXZ6_DALPE|nr:hypothetical protein DPEC_G00104030 [Dallia pectoralis]
MFVLCLVLGLLIKACHPVSFLYARLGDSMTLQCFYPGKGSSKTVFQQPVSESVQSGDSVTLNCTITTETCEGEHSVYWVRHDSGESPPGIIYTHGDRSGQCKNSTETGSPTQSCVYNLPKRNLSLSDAGTYYCAVVSCGEILFGHGTKMDIQELRSQHGCHGNVNSSMSNEQLHDFTMVNYASLNFTDKKTNQSRRTRREPSDIRKEREEETIYSGLRHQDSATYFCGGGYSNMVVFGQGAILHVKAFSPDSESGSISVLQQPVSESVQPGDSVTLNCTIKTETCEGEHSVYWFRRGSGESHPGIIYTHGDRSGQCKNSTETGSPTQSCVYNLPKRNLSLSDAGTYYCAVVSCGEILFGNGTNLEVKGPSMTVLQQPVSESVQPEDSVTLNCTINTGTCEGEHSVYWFRHDSGESHPGIIYTHGDRSGQCKNSPETGSPTQSCVYNLPKRNLSLSDAGTYYCAVVSCGEILFGKGTNLDVGGCKGNHLLLLYCLGTALGLCVILITVLTCVLYKINTSNGITNQLVQLSPVIIRIKRMTHSITPL